MYIDLKNNQLILSFKYNIDTIQFIKGIPERRWNYKDKTWRIPATLENYERIFNNYTSAVELSPKVLSWHNDIQTINRQIKHAQKFKHFIEPPLDYIFKTKPFDHQIKCFNFLKNIPIGALFLEMGLGKTKIIVDILSYHKLMGNINKPILYICPNSVLENTKREFELHSPLKNLNICTLTGSRDKKIKLLNTFTYWIYIINYEAVRTIEQDLLKKKFAAIICDESTRIKNTQAQCSKAIHRLGKSAKYRYLLTGTPVTQSAIDVYSQYKFLEPSIFGPSFYAFKNRYAIMGGYLNKQIVGYRYLDELQEKLFKIAVRFTKDECLDLPPKIYETKKFNLNKEEQELYNKIKNNILIEIQDKQLSAQLIITKLIKLNQVCAGFVKLDSGENLGWKKSSKLELLKELLDDILPNKMIIWTTFTASIKQISKMLNRMNVGHVTFYGETPQNKRQEAIDKFQTNKNCKIFLGQIKTGGLGLNLTAAAYVIYYSNTYSLADRLQSEDRAHRIGQTHNITYLDLVARNTVEQSILKALTKKQNLAHIIVDNEKLKEVINGIY